LLNRVGEKSCPIRLKKTPTNAEKKRPGKAPLLEKQSESKPVSLQGRKAVAEKKTRPIRGPSSPIKTVLVSDLGGWKNLACEHGGCLFREGRAQGGISSAPVEGGYPGSKGEVLWGESGEGARGGKGAFRFVESSLWKKNFFPGVS